MRIWTKIANFCMAVFLPRRAAPAKDRFFLEGGQRPEIINTYRWSYVDESQPLTSYVAYKIWEVTGRWPMRWDRKKIYHVNIYCSTYDGCKFEVRELNIEEAQKITWVRIR